MEYRESLDILLKECRLVTSVAELDKLVPDVEKFAPPFASVRFSDNRAPRFVWGYPVVPSRRLVGQLHQMLSSLLEKCLANSSFQEDLQNRTPAELKRDPYVNVLVELLLKSQAEGAYLRLDSVFWIHLTDFVSRYLNQDESALALARKAGGSSQSEASRTVELELARIRVRDVKTFGELKARVLRSLLVRHEFAIRSVRDIFEDAPPNSIAREMTANRLIYTERPDSLYTAADLTEAFCARDYNLRASEFTALRSMLRVIILGILFRSRSGQLLPYDAYFLRIANLPEARIRAQLFPPAVSRAISVYGELDPKEADELERMSWFLALQEAPVRYILYHVSEDDRNYLKPVEKLNTVPKEMFKVLRSRDVAVTYEMDYNEVVRDLRQWDFLNTLRHRLRNLDVQGDQMSSEGRPLDKRNSPLNLDSPREIYRRARYGTAVFFDLIGFTDRTKHLMRQAQTAKGGGEVAELSLMSLSVQRIFAVRTELEHFGGIAQGFEGDAILDIFGQSLLALRYVSRFADNYTKHRTVRYRPFEAPSENPYKDGWRVGLASGDYTMISIMARTSEGRGDHVQERAVGHTINRASRLNSGKKGQNFYLDVEEDSQLKHQQQQDPLGVFRVQVNEKRELNNNGICSYRETFEEIRNQVKQENLSWYEPSKQRGTLVAGVEPRFGAYQFEFVFEDRDTSKIFLIRQVPVSPRLKGLEDEEVVVFEYLIHTKEEFLAFVEAESKLKSKDRDVILSQRTPAAPLGPLDRPRLAQIQRLEASGILPEALIQRDLRLLTDEETQLWEDEAREMAGAAQSLVAKEEDGASDLSSLGLSEGDFMAEELWSQMGEGDSPMGQLRDDGEVRTDQTPDIEEDTDEVERPPTPPRPSTPHPPTTTPVLPAGGQEDQGYLDPDIASMAVDSDDLWGDLGGLGDGLEPDLDTATDDSFPPDPHFWSTPGRPASPPMAPPPPTPPPARVSPPPSPPGTPVARTVLSPPTSTAGSRSPAPPTSPPPPPPAAEVSLDWQVQRMLQYLDEGGGQEHHGAGTGAEFELDLSAEVHSLGADEAYNDPRAKQSNPRLDEVNLRSYVYLIEMSRGPEAGPTGYQFGKLRQGKLEDLHTYRMNDFPRHMWGFDEVLRRFHADKEEEGDVPNGKMLRLDPMDEVHPLTAADLELLG